MSDLDAPLAMLPEPADLSVPFGRLAGELLSHLPESAVMAYATTLLDGDDPTRHPTALRYLGGRHAVILLERDDLALWPAVWGARTLLYAWDARQAGEATRLVAEHLADERWRVADMCCKVVHKRELAECADRVVPLTAHRLARVRRQAARALGRIGEREHLEAIQHCLSDEDEDVRKTALKAMELRAAQLDLDVHGVMDGRTKWMEDL